MASASQAIASRADEHQQLLQTLGELDYAPSALIQAQERLKTLQADVGPKREALSKYARETKREWDEWQAVQTSMLKRASLRIKGGRDNLNQRVEKEEAEWLDALRAESREKDELAMLEQEIGEMQTLVKDLEGLKATHDQTQARLDQLYETVFSGPTNEFPDEDNAETDLYVLEKSYKDNQADVNKIAQATNLLAKADTSLQAAIKALTTTAQSLESPMLFRGRFADYVERESIQVAANHVSRVSSFWLQASRYHPALGVLSLPSVDGLAQAYLQNQVFYASLSAMDALSIRVSATQRALHAALQEIRTKIRELQASQRQLERKGKSIHLNLRRARLQLDSTRRQIMIDVAHSNRELAFITQEPESFASEGGEAGADGQAGGGDGHLASNNPYAHFLASRANSIDQPDEPLPVYQPRTRQYSNLLRE